MELSEESLVAVAGGAGFGKTFCYALAGSAAGMYVAGIPGAFVGAFVMALRA